MANPMILFLDTEFTGLGQQWPRLTSIGLVSEDGAREFYAELAPEGYMEKVPPWVRDNVLPLLQGGDYVVSPADLPDRLAHWIASLGPVQIVTDAPDCDFQFLELLLAPWPEDLCRRPIRFDTTSLGRARQEELATYRGAYYTKARPEHHALHDAKALRQMWRRAAGLDEFHTFLEKMELR